MTNSYRTMRQWRDLSGYRNLVQWTNLAFLRFLIRKFTSTLPVNKSSNHPLEYRLKIQMDDAARSAMSTLEEGWKRPSTKEYLDFLGFNQPLIPSRSPICSDYPPLKSLHPSKLTFDMFLELINKTDYVLRNLVTSLQQKDPLLTEEKQGDAWLKEQIKKIKEADENNKNT